MILNFSIVQVHSIFFELISVYFPFSVRNHFYYYIQLILILHTILRGLSFIFSLFDLFEKYVN